MKKVMKIDSPDLNKMITPELLGQVIRARRTQSNLRLEDAAQLCGVAKQTLMNIEHGHSTSQLTTILQVCNALGLQLRILPWQENNENDNEWQ